MRTTTIMSGKTNSADNVTHRRNNSNNSVFREAQTDLLHPFQGHHYDLLGGNPPPHNPDFVAQHSQHHSNPPPHNPDFVPTSDSQRTNLPLTRSELSMLAGSFSASPAVRRVSHNPFEETRSSNPFEAAVSQDPVLLAPPPRATVVHEHNPSGAFSSSSSSTSVPVASVVAISEDEEDTAIPFVSAMRIDEEEQETSLEREHSARSSTSSSSSQHFAAPGPAVRAAHSRDQIRVQPSPRERPPPLVFHPRAHQDPEWLGRQQQQQRQSAPNARQHRKSNSIGTAIRRYSYTNWSRISVQAEAAVRETKRSLKKAIGREAKKLKKSIGKETKVLRRAIREDMDRMAAVRHSSCRRR